MVRRSIDNHAGVTLWEEAEAIQVDADSADEEISFQGGECASKKRKLGLKQKKDTKNTMKQILARRQTLVQNTSAQKRILPLSHLAELTIGNEKRAECCDLIKEEYISVKSMH